MLSNTARKDDEACLVGFQAFNIEGEGFGGKIGTARVDRDAYGGCVFFGDTGFLFVVEPESAASSVKNIDEL